MPKPKQDRGYTADDVTAVPARNGVKIRKKVGPQTLSLYRDPSTGRLTSSKTTATMAQTEVLNMFYCGKTAKEVERYLQSIGYTKNQAIGISIRIRKEIAQYVEKQKEDIANQNVLILKNIIEKAMADERYKIAIEAVQELNRMLHVYDEKVEINIVNNGFEFGGMEIADESKIEDV